MKSKTKTNVIENLLRQVRQLEDDRSQLLLEPEANCHALSHAISGKKALEAKLGARIDKLEDSVSGLGIDQDKLRDMASVLPPVAPEMPPDETPGEPIRFPVNEPPTGAGAGAVADSEPSGSAPGQARKWRGDIEDTVE